MFRELLQILRAKPQAINNLMCYKEKRISRKVWAPPPAGQKWERKCGVREAKLEDSPTLTDWSKEFLAFEPGLDVLIPEIRLLRWLEEIGSLSLSVSHWKHKGIFWDLTKKWWRREHVENIRAPDWVWAGSLSMGKIVFCLIFVLVIPWLKNITPPKQQENQI